MKGKLPVHDIRHSYFLQVLFVFLLLYTCRLFLLYVVVVSFSSVGWLFTFVEFFFHVFVTYFYMQCFVYKGSSWLNWSHLFESFTVAIMIWLTVMKYMCHKWQRICSACCKHFPVLSSFITYQRVWN